MLRLLLGAAVAHQGYAARWVARDVTVEERGGMAPRSPVQVSVPSASAGLSRSHSRPVSFCSWIFPHVSLGST